MVFKIFGSLFVKKFQNKVSACLYCMKSLSNRENPCSYPLYEACSSFPTAAPVILKTGLKAEPVFVNLLRSPGINSQSDGPVQQPYLP